MGEEEQDVILQWEDHKSDLIETFGTYLKNNKFVDCTLAAEGKYIRAHKIVLSACSSYLERLLLQNCEKHPLVILKDVKFEELKNMIEFIYKGEITIKTDKIDAFMIVANLLEITCLEVPPPAPAENRSLLKVQQSKSKKQKKEVKYWQQWVSNNVEQIDEDNQDYRLLTLAEYYKRCNEFI